MSITKELFGRLSDGREVYIYTLKNANGMTVRLSEFGAAIVSLCAPDRPVRSAVLFIAQKIVKSANDVGKKSVSIRCTKRYYSRTELGQPYGHSVCIFKGIDIYFSSVRQFAE